VWLFLPFLSYSLIPSSEIGELLCLKSKYGPGGEFEADWYVLLCFYCPSLLLMPLYRRPSGPLPQPPPDDPPIPDVPPVTTSIWRPYHPRGKKKKKEQ
jgi:hypothetical protein